MPTYDDFEYYGKYNYEDELSPLKNEFLGVENPRELIQAELNTKKSFYQDFIVNKKTLIQALLNDAIIGLIDELNYSELFKDFLKNDSDEIKKKGLSIDDLVKYIKHTSITEILETFFQIDIYTKVNEYLDLIDSCYPGYKRKRVGNNFLGSLISFVQFKYIMNALLLEEIPGNYTADSCKEKAFVCSVCDRSGWYNFKTVDLTEERDIYHFNPQYSTTICIALPTKNEEEKIFIMGLYHWELQLLYLNLPDSDGHLSFEHGIAVCSPKREPYNAKDGLEMQRYLQEMESENNDEE